MEQILQVFYDNGGDPNMPMTTFDYDDMSAIHLASKLAIPEVTAVLLKQEADPNSITQQTDTPMHLVANTLHELKTAGLLGKVRCRRYRVVHASSVLCPASDNIVIHPIGYDASPIAGL